VTLQPIVNAPPEADVNVIPVPGLRFNTPLLVALVNQAVPLSYIARQVSVSVALLSAAQYTELPLLFNIYPLVPEV